ncbi:MAG TPA: hypothetical protein VGC99_06300, partial [Candidatus Tectomicrobia bacterium]
RSLPPLDPNETLRGFRAKRVSHRRGYGRKVQSMAGQDKDRPALLECGGGWEVSIRSRQSRTQNAGVQSSCS